MGGKKERKPELPSYAYFTDGEFRAELDKCLYCREKPCRDACPSHCSPADFIMAARQGKPADLGRAAEEILKHNPLGESCGVVCPDTFCMAACSRKTFDTPLNIPKLQATIVRRARDLGVIAQPSAPLPNGHRVAVVGAGPAGLAASAWLAREGYTVDLFEAMPRAGGAAALIPEGRLPVQALDGDAEGVLKSGAITAHFGERVAAPDKLLREDFAAVLVAAGEEKAAALGVPGEKLTISSLEYLRDPSRFPARGKVAVIGGGAVAADCAVTARKQGAQAVEMFVRRTLADMPLTSFEREMLLKAEIDITTRTRIQAVARKGKGLVLKTTKVEPRTVRGKASLADIPGTSTRRPGFDLVIMAVGASTPEGLLKKRAGVFFAGDCLHGASTVVEAVASGKNAARELDLFVRKAPKKQADELAAARIPGPRSRTKSRLALSGIGALPVDLSTSFFGLPISSPFLLSAAPATDGFEQMKLAYEAGWAGGVMKTAFDGLPIHIPNNYMVTFNDATYGNCDNVSGHALERVCGEIAKLRKLFPDRLTMGSTGGPVTGHDESDAKVWQANTAKLERAGAMVVEYSLSCPQGGDGTEGAIVSQSAAATAKVIDWVLSQGDGSVPKLFKLTSAVTSLKPILKAVAEVFAKYPQKKAGITLANSFPVMAFRERAPGLAGQWDEGVIVGMSGEGVAPISYLALADAAPFGLVISGNGGVMDYRSGANFLALGAQTVQVCTVVMKHGLGIIDELNSGLSHLLAAQGLRSVQELIGRALPHPVTAFGDLSATKQISAVRASLCKSCGNCANCGYLAIRLNEHGIPVTDPSRCVGCSICAKNCFSGALIMRDRTPAEAKALKED